MSKLHESLKGLLEETGITQSQLSAATGISNSNISDFLKGIHEPSYQALWALLRYFQCSADYLLGLTDIHTDEPLCEAVPFSQRLREMLKEKNISQQFLIKNMSLSSSVVYKWLAGISQPSTDALIRLSKFFDCSVDYLIGRVR